MQAEEYSSNLFEYCYVSMQLTLYTLSFSKGQRREMGKYRNNLDRNKERIRHEVNLDGVFHVGDV